MAQRVLLVDDDYNILNLLENFMAMKGFEVETAENGYVALKKIETFKPNVILLDIMMPRMDGYEVCSKIRDLSDAHLARTPILVMSALNHLNDVKKAISSGANDYIVKPINLQILFEKINRYVRIDSVIKKENLEDSFLTIEKLERGLVLSIQGLINEEAYELLARNITGLPKSDFLILFFQNINNVDRSPVIVLDAFIELYNKLNHKNKVIAAEQKNLYSLIEPACRQKKIKIYNTLMEAYEGVR